MFIPFRGCKDKDKLSYRNDIHCFLSRIFHLKSFSFFRRGFNGLGGLFI